MQELYAVIVTTIDFEDEPEQRARKGFVPVCRYGAQIVPAENEIGGIFKPWRKKDRVSIKNGVFVQDAICIERIFIKIGS
jgi:hypothetical protein